MKQQLVISLASFLMLTPNLQAEMYKWTDEEGKVIYSQNPPPDDRSVTTIKPPPPAASQSPTKGADEKAATEVKTKDNGILDMELRKKNCKIARHNLKMLKTAAPTAKFKTEDGRKVNYSRNELDKKRKENLALEKAWCD